MQTPLECQAALTRYFRLTENVLLSGGATRQQSARSYDMRIFGDLLAKSPRWFANKSWEQKIVSLMYLRFAQLRRASLTEEQADIIYLVTFFVSYGSKTHRRTK